MYLGVFWCILVAAVASGSRHRVQPRNIEDPNGIVIVEMSLSQTLRGWSVSVCMQTSRETADFRCLSPSINSLRGDLT